MSKRVIDFLAYLKPFLITGGITFVASCLLSKFEMKNQAKRMLYLDELKKIKEIALDVFKSVKNKEGISVEIFRNMDNFDTILTLEDRKVRGAWQEYTQLIRKYSAAYSKAKSTDPYEFIPTEEEINRIHNEYHKRFEDSSKKLNKEIEKFLIK